MWAGKVKTYPINRRRRSERGKSKIDAAALYWNGKKESSSRRGLKGDRYQLFGHQGTIAQIESTVPCVAVQFTIVVLE